MTGCEQPQESAFSSRSNANPGQDMPSKWSSSVFPLRINISDSFDSSEGQAIRDMANEWTNSVNGVVDFMDSNYTTQEKSSALSDYEDGIIGVYIVEVNFESIAFGFIRVLIELLVKTQKAAR